jgi:hypothetical protein
MPEVYTDSCPHVYVGKDHPSEWIPADWTEFEDISEGPDGKDIMAFKWRGKQYTSWIINKQR